MLPIGLTELGTTLEVEPPTERVRAVVVEKPFIDPKKETPKQALGPAPG
jgi:aminomethyltransferase